MEHEFIGAVILAVALTIFLSFIIEGLKRRNKKQEEETEPFYKHRFVAELLEDLKLIVEEIGDGVKPTDHIDKFIDSQFWD